MKNIIRKSFCLVLVLCLALAFAGCGNDTKDAQEAKATVTAFMDALVKLDIPEASKYVDNPDVINNLGLGDITGQAIEQAIAQNPAMAPYKDKFVPIAEKSIEKAKQVSSYKILAEESSADGFVYTVELTTPTNGSAAEEQLKKAMGEYTTEEGIMKLLNELLASGKITMSSSQEEITNATFDVLVEKILVALDSVTFEAATEEMQVSVSKPADKWLVNTVEAK